MDDLDLPDDGFSMGNLEKDLKRGRGARRLPWLLTGLVLGIAGTIALPRFAGPYLPAVLRGSTEVLSGPVLAEERDGDRLLLTIETEAGALIASFSERVAEIAMLVEPGDRVTIAVPDYEPFVENPDFEGVQKGAGLAPPSAGAPDERPGEGGAATADSMSADTTVSTSAAADAGAPPPDTVAADTVAADTLAPDTSAADDGG